MLNALRAVVGASLAALLFVFFLVPGFSRWIDENPWTTLFAMTVVIVIVTKLFPNGDDLNDWVYRDDI
ncbi:MAG: hypothetical protein ACRBM6_12130 [Geminicoccales bacterium]